VGLKVLADLILRPARSRRYFTNSTWSGASPTERAYQELKGELGFDHYEGRSFVGWHHHV